MTEELKPCPFCGSEEIEIRSETTGHGACDLIVECGNCRARSRPNYAGNEHIEAWNRRVEDAELRDDTNG